jgi:CheY-like chemotaxis protein
VEDSARVRVIGDVTRTRQILAKLVGNAVKHTPNGEIEARIAIEPQKDGGQLLVMTVRDTGAGMGETELAIALNEGAGGGLALCRRLCRAMGGDLEVKSSSDYGTSVRASLRVREAAPELATAPTSASASSLAGTAGDAVGSGRRLSVLAADDNEINRVVLKDLLEPLDLDLTLVENGADAIAAWRVQRFDVILMDIHMPVLSGCDVAREIRRIEAEDGRTRTPIIAVSASVMKSEVDECMASGMDAHVPKPLELAKLQSAIETAVADAPAHEDAKGAA